MRNRPANILPMKRTGKSLNWMKVVLVIGVLGTAFTFYARSTNTSHLTIWTEQPADATVCGEAITFTVHVQNISTDDIENIKVYPQMPQGMIYIPGTARYQGGALLSEIEPTGNSPGFILPNSLGVAAGTDEAIITFNARASCAILAHIGSNPNNLVNNITKVEFNLRTEGPTNIREEFEPNGSTSYNILAAAAQYFVAAGDDNLSLTSPTQIFNRTITITNSGTGALDNLSLYAEFDENLDYRKLFIAVNGSDVELTPASVSTTSVRYDIDLVSLGLSFRPNDQLVFKDEVMAASFRPSIATKYFVRWGCDALECNSTSPEGLICISFLLGFRK